MEPLLFSPDDLAAMVEAFGFLPLLKNRIPGFSVEEHTPPSLWFVRDVDGPWEWKGPVIQQTGCAYGKFFGGKAGFISAKWYPDFANYRRGGLDMDERYAAGLVAHRDKAVYDLLASHDSLVSRDLRHRAGFARRADFDTLITRLQMQGYLTTVDFFYPLDAHGQPYGWGVARYAVPERCFGTAFSRAVYKRKPEDSLARIETHLKRLLPDVQPRQLRWITGTGG